MTVSECIHTPADNHGSDDRLPAGVEQGAAGRVFGGDHHPHWSQRQEEGTHQGRHVRVRVYTETNRARER